MLIIADRKGISKVPQSKNRDIAVPDIPQGEKDRQIPEKQADERIETIKNEVLETIKKLKELELDD